MLPGFFELVMQINFWILESYGSTSLSNLPILS